MSYWMHNQTSSPQIDAILAKEDLSLSELFEQDCLFQELKSSNKALIDYIKRNDVLSDLVRLITEEPSSDLDEKERYKLSNIACEVLTTDTPAINEKLSDELHLSKLYSFLESEPPLNPLLASFFSRTLSMLICRKHDQHWYSYQLTCLQVLDFLKSRTKSLDLLLKHLGTSSIMELTLKLLTKVEGQDLQATLFNLLENECLIDKIVGLFDSSVDEEKHYNASTLLCETIYKFKDDINNMSENGEKRKDSNPILNKIQSVATVEKLLSNCFGEAVSESGIVSGVSVLLALLCPPPSSCVDVFSNNMVRRGCDELASGSVDSLQMQAVQSQTNILPILSTIIPYLPRFHHLLLHPPKREGIKLACGVVDPPLGQARLHIIKLLSTLISTNTPEINAKLDELNTVQILLDLFFQYVWNNFLHAQVEKCLVVALNTSTLSFSNNVPQESNTEESNNSQPNPLLANIFVKCRILERILEAWDDNEIKQKEGKGRRGYMGHLINIANNIERQCEDECIATFVQDNVQPDILNSWNFFVTQTLQPIIDIHNKCLGGQHPSQISDDDDLSMKVTFDVQEPTIKLLSNQVSFHLNKDGNNVSDSDIRSNMQLDYSTIIDNILPIFQDRINIEEEDMFVKKICDMKDSTWQDMPTIGHPSCNSSDEELDEDEDTVVWSTCSSGGGILDSGNPWSGLGSTGGSIFDSTGISSAGDSALVDSDQGWANFDSNFSQGFPSDPSVIMSETQAQDTSITPSNNPTPQLSNDIISNVLPDDDCFPPTEFEYEDSTDNQEEDIFEQASNSIQDFPEVPTQDISKETSPFIESNSTVKKTSCTTEISSVSDSSLVKPSECLVPSNSNIVETDTSRLKSTLLSESLPVDFNTATLATVNESQDSRLTDKGSVDSSSVKVVNEVEKGKENKVPETSDNALVGDVKMDEPV